MPFESEQNAFEYMLCMRCITLLQRANLMPHSTLACISSDSLVNVTCRLAHSHRHSRSVPLSSCSLSDNVSATSAAIERAPLTFYWVAIVSACWLYGRRWCGARRKEIWMKGSLRVMFVELFFRLEEKFKKFRLQYQLDLIFYNNCLYFYQILWNSSLEHFHTKFQGFLFTLRRFLLNSKFQHLQKNNLNDGILNNSHMVIFERASEMRLC